MKVNKQITRALDRTTAVQKGAHEWGDRSEGHPFDKDRGPRPEHSGRPNADQEKR